MAGLWELTIATGDATRSELTQILKLSATAKPGDYQRLTVILNGIIERQRAFLERLVL